MRTIILPAAITFLLLCLCTSCKTQYKYIPVENVKTEYRDNYIYDSIAVYDSIFVKEKGDTLIFEKYKYLYRDKIVRDSVVMTDTIRVPYPVEVVKEVKIKEPPSGWENFQIWCERIAMGVALLVALYFARKLKK
ncbi:hypothetical protein AGMMS49525_07630 [Bacteroidia bacterium]|nr:hypothetical protein AGMMS49525_07630 [Bacteroidia bacterium]